MPIEKLEVRLFSFITQDLFTFEGERRRETDRELPPDLRDALETHPGTADPLKFLSSPLVIRNSGSP